MRLLLTIIIGLFCTVSAYADCEGSGLSVFPSGQTIKQNSIFVLDGYAESQNIILALNKKFNIYLKSGDKKVRLLVTETHVGEFLLTQAVLKPETKLEVGLEYTMYIDSLPEYEFLNRYNKKTEQNELVTYIVLADNDTEKPLVNNRPKEIKKTLEYYGCGPSIHVIFDFSAKDNSEIIIRTTVKNQKTGFETIYYILPTDNKIKVGHGMCAGAFQFDESNNYEIEFSFMDASGNLTVWSGQRIKFTKPTKQTNQSDE